MSVDGVGADCALGVAAFEDAGSSDRSQAESPRKVKVKAKVIQPNVCCLLLIRDFSST
jgi:hypothetical protein